ncbi:MAG: PaaX family transcriptional regulator C-terminal domain-containing protein [Actinomycetota bacterium]
MASPRTESLAPVLGARRDGTAQADSTRGLLVTVLGELVLPAGGAAWTRPLLGALELLGVRDKAARQALSRLADEGWLERERHGRRTRWRLTDGSAALLGAGAERIYGFGQGRPDWDGRWVVVVATVPERDRSTRYRMGQALSWAGFGSIGNGLWVCPWIDREAAAVAALAGLGVEAMSFRAEVGAMGTGADLAARAWDLPALASSYRSFLAEVDRSGGAPRSDDGAVERLVRLVHDWRRFPFLDPDLPDELLPDGWVGSSAARRFAEERARLVPHAQRWWRALEERTEASA